MALMVIVVWAGGSDAVGWPGAVVSDSSVSPGPGRSCDPGWIASERSSSDLGRCGRRCEVVVCG